MTTILPTGTNLDHLKGVGSYLVTSPAGLEAGPYLVEVMTGADASGVNFLVQKILNLSDGLEQTRAEQSNGTFSTWTGFDPNTEPLLTELEDSTDLNTIDTAGSYYVDSPVNGPSSGIMYIEVVKRDEDWVMQLANIAATGRLKWRLRVNGTWDAFWSGPSCSDLFYSNATSGLSASNVQAAIDELAGRVDLLENPGP